MAKGRKRWTFQRKQRGGCPPSACLLRPPVGGVSDAAHIADGRKSSLGLPSPGPVSSRNIQKTCSTLSLLACTCWAFGCEAGPLGLPAPAQVVPWVQGSCWWPLGHRHTQRCHLFGGEAGGQPQKGHSGSVATDRDLSCPLSQYPSPGSLGKCQGL